MDIVIVVPFEDAETQTAVWANEESDIDFRRDSYGAARCTTAFAATELQHYLSSTLKTVSLSFHSCRVDDAFCIELQVIDPCSKDEAFSLEPISSGIVIRGQGRTGVLYGAYELLRMQGWRWYAPGKEGKISPQLRENLVLPGKAETVRPMMDAGRGFFFEYVSQDSVEFLLWMARNRLNQCGAKRNTQALASKLGMITEIGGHIFEPILAPDRVMETGRTLWEEHPQWFGLPASGVRSKQEALNTQFCFSQPDLLEFLAAELLRYLNGQWKDADCISLWGFDTWGSTCTCSQCSSLGNGTDQILYFMSHLRNKVNQWRADGTLDHDVKLATCSYEGTSTITGPEKPVPQNLIDAGDYVVFYPINRCYAHDFADSDCSWNTRYAAALKSWFVQESGLKVVVGEYYNVGRFEDLPILFTKRITHDLAEFHRIGARGITYMHVPMVNWGVRTLTQLVYAQMAWDSQTDVEAFLQEYFQNWYGPYADRMRKAYQLQEEAWAGCACWRAWSADSVLSQLQRWDGAVPQEPLSVSGHYEAAEDVVEAGRRSISLMQEAMALLDEVRMEDRHAVAANALETVEVAVNPIQQRELELRCSYEKRLGEDRRLLLYGLHTMTLMTDLTAYHDALCRGDQHEAAVVWERCEETADILDSYYVPIGYESPAVGAGFVSKDALTRSQLREVMRRCRSHRQKAPSDQQAVSDLS